MSFLFLWPFLLNAAQDIAPVTQIDSGAEHTCALHVSGEISCWGWSFSGQAGPRAGMWNYYAQPIDQGFSRPFPVANFTQISAGHLHSCGIRDGHVLCWGMGAYGQLGNGDMIIQKYPALVLSQDQICPLEGITQVSAGGKHTCAIQDKQLLCWGQGKYGQLGNGSFDQKYFPTPVKINLQNITQVSAGSRHTCALRQDGKGFCWGKNYLKKTYPVPQPLALSDIKFISAGHEHSCALLNNGDAYCWGQGEDGQLGTGDYQSYPRPARVKTRESFIQIKAGHRHSCGITEKRKILCWGQNNYWQLGNQKLKQTPKPTLLPGQLPPFKQVSLGEKHTCALSNMGKVYCWGRGRFGLLGNGKKKNQSNPSLVIHKFLNNPLL